MFKDDTVLFLGAGASYEYSYPLGADLNKLILELILNNDFIIKASQSGFTNEHLAKLGEQIKYGGYDSIDQLLGRNEDLTSLGKQAIAWILLQRENIDNINIKDTWYDNLFGFLDKQQDDFSKNKLKIITLNYDRSLEKFLQIRLKARYENSFIEIMNKIEIIHLHGRLPPLPFEDPSVGLEYGSVKPGSDHIDLGKVSSNIIVLHEKDSNSAEYSRAKKIIADAKEIYFIGFGFHEDVLNRLEIDWNTFQTRYILTANDVLYNFLSDSSQYKYCSLFHPADNCKQMSFSLKKGALQKRILRPEDVSRKRNSP